MKTNLIYGLMDPRNDLFYYIGKTTVGHKRPMTHLARSHNEQVKEWVLELGKIGLTPSIHIIESNINLNSLRDREVYWINEYKKINDDLFNHQLIEKNEISKTIHIGNINEIEFIFNNIGLVCKSARIKLNLSQEEFSKMIGVNRATLSLVENGNKNISFNMVLKILNILISNSDKYNNELNITIYGDDKRVRTLIANK